MFTQRYMYETGCKSTDLAQVALSTRRYAVNNPNAFFYQKELTLEEHQNSRMIVDPLHLYDCCQETDGGCACVVTTPERAKDLKQPGALIRGIAQAAADDQEVMTSLYRPKIACLPEMDCGSSSPSGCARRARPRTSSQTGPWSWAAGSPATPMAGSSPRPTSTE
jgi:acetyl-CoA acetyltransferase